MAGIKIGIDPGSEPDFREFARALGVTDIRAEPVSAAGGLELVHINIIDLEHLQISAQFAWGALLGWAMARSKFFEVFNKGSRIQPSKNDVIQLEKLATPAKKRLSPTQTKKNAVKKKRVVATRKKNKR